MTDNAPGSVFGFPGRSGTEILVNLSGTSPVNIAGNATQAVQVAWFQVTETANGTANLTIDIYDTTTSTAYVFHPAGAMTAHGEYFYGRGFWLSPNQFLRVTISAGTASVIGVATIPAQLN